MGFSATADVAVAHMTVTYIRSSGEHAPAAIIDRSTRGCDFFRVKYGMGMRLSVTLLGTVSSSRSNPSVVRVRYGPVCAAYSSLGTTPGAQARRCPSTAAPSARCCPDFQRRLRGGGRGGGYVAAQLALQNTFIAGHRTRCLSTQT